MAIVSDAPLEGDSYEIVTRFRLIDNNEQPPLTKTRLPIHTSRKKQEPTLSLRFPDIKVPRFALCGRHVCKEREWPVI